MVVCCLNTIQSNPIFFGYSCTLGTSPDPRSCMLPALSVLWPRGTRLAGKYHVLWQLCVMCVYSSVNLIVPSRNDVCRHIRPKFKFSTCIILHHLKLGTRRRRLRIDSLGPTHDGPTHGSDARAVHDRARAWMCVRWRRLNQRNATRIGCSRLERHKSETHGPARQIYAVHINICLPVRCEGG
jgi:hypothetical protein